MSERLLAQHPDKPLDAVWESLTQYADTELSMAIILDQRCGIERKTTVKEVSMKSAKGTSSTLLESGATPLLLAAHANRLDVVVALIAANADPTASCTRTGVSALHCAIDNGNLEMVTRLVAYGVPLDVGFHCPVWPTLHFAISFFEPSVGLLVQAGVVLNSLNFVTQTPLQLAAQMGRTQSIRLLVAAGADINEGPLTALFISATNKNTETFELLCSLGASLDIPNVFTGDTLLHYAIERPNKTLLNSLLSKELNIDVKNNYHLTALHKAVSLNLLGVARELVSNGAAVGAVDNQLATPLHQATKGRMSPCVIDIILLLLDAGADMSVMDLSGASAQQILYTTNPQSSLQRLAGEISQPMVPGRQ